MPASARMSSVASLASFSTMTTERRMDAISSSWMPREGEKRVRFLRMVAQKYTCICHGKD
jgi:hypothetical protein